MFLNSHIQAPPEWLLKAVDEKKAINFKSRRRLVPRDFTTDLQDVSAGRETGILGCKRETPNNSLDLLADWLMDVCELVIRRAAKKTRRSEKNKNFIGMKT